MTAACLEKPTKASPFFQPIKSKTNTARRIAGKKISKQAIPSAECSVAADCDINVIALYHKEIGRYPLLTAEEEINYGRLAREGDLEGRRKMIVSNLRLVVKFAKRYVNRGLPILDLIEEGNLGLMHAVGKFDPERGFRFSTYATWWIRQAIERAIMNQSHAVRLPVHINKEINSCNRAARNLRSKGGHEASAVEIAEFLNKPVEHVRHMLQLDARTTSSIISDAEGGEHSALEGLDVLLDNQEEDPEIQLQSEDELSYLVGCVSKLREKERQVIMYRFGLNGCKALTLEEVGNLLGVTRERVRQIQVGGIEQLRTMLGNQPIPEISHHY